MKNIIDMPKSVMIAVLIVVLLVTVAGCTIEPIQSEPVVVIAGAPEWVNKGSRIESRKEGRLFLGVSSSNPQGDLALQKSIADDRSAAEVIRVLLNYLEVVANDYIASARFGDNGENEDAIMRQIDEASAKQIKESVARQIDEAISRQFKDNVTSQFKEDISRQIKAEANRQIRSATSSQIEFSRELEETISSQIKRSVSHQIKNTARANLSGTRIMGSWRDPKTNVIWSISELDIKHVKTTVADVKDMNVELRNFFEVNAEIIFDRIIKERDNPNPFAAR